MNYNQGFLVTGKPLFYNNIQYNGIECNPWPLDREMLEQTFTMEQLDLFDSKIDDLNVKNGIALLDIVLLKSYIRACKEYNQEYCIKFVEIYRTDSCNTADNCFLKSIAKSYRFLGYDVGECAYDYYSAVLSDVINRPSLFGVNIKNSLNDDGLFDSLDEAQAFLAQRQMKMKFDAESTYERCNPEIIKIYSLNF